jgi:phosphate transport system substrate-binding protein
VLPQFAAVNNQAYRQGRWQVIYHDDGMVEALENIEGSIGLHGGGTGPGTRSYKALRIDGVEPTTAEVLAGDYPFEKTFAFVTIGPPADGAKRLIEFVASSDGRAIIESYGGVAVLGSGVG